MKKVIFLSLVLAASGLFAQQTPPNPPAPGPGPQKQNINPEKRKEKIQAMKVGYITQKLQLTTPEAEKFWPVYNEFDQKRQDLRKKFFANDNKKSIDSMSDKEVESRVDAEISFREQETQLMKDYNAKFKAILPVKKVAKLYQPEREFKMQVMGRQMKRQHMNKQKQMPPPPPGNEH